MQPVEDTTAALLADEAGETPGRGYVPETIPFIQLRSHVTAEALKRQAGHVEMAYALLKQSLYRMYGTTDIPRLVLESRNIDCVLIFVNTARRAMQQVGWATSTTHTVWATLKAILAETCVTKAFIAKMFLSYTTTRVGVTELDARERLIASIIGPSKYLRMSPSERVAGEKLVHTVRTKSRNRSKLSIAHVISFWLNICYKRLGVSLDDDIAPDVLERVDGLLGGNGHGDGVVREICGTSSRAAKHFRWLQLLVTHVFGMERVLDSDWVRVHTLNVQEARFARTLDDGSDMHRLSRRELEKLHEVSAGNPRDRLMFLALLTTGMRIGGLVKIRTNDVVVVEGPDVRAKSTGRTLEKGRKWFSFVIAPVLRAPLTDWVKLHRPACSSVFLFPSKGGISGHISTNTLRFAFRKMCVAAGLEGKHLHPHSLRHSFAHILLEVGNSVDNISKLLGHTNTETTEKYYLRESAAQVVRRANIPWMTSEDETQLDPVPSFLAGSSNKKPKKTRRNKMARINAFSTNVTYRNT